MKWKKQMMTLAICMVFLVAFNGVVSATVQFADEIATEEVLTQQEQRLLLLYSQQNDTLKNKAISDLPIVKSFPSPTSSPRGLEYDGTYLYVAQASSLDYIYIR